MLGRSGVKQCVITSPGRSVSAISSIVSRVWPMWTMTGVPLASPACSASRSASRPFSSTDGSSSRTLMPTATSRCSCTVRAAPAGSANSRWRSSFGFCSTPCCARQTNASILVRAGAAMNRLKPRKLTGPADPASTAVVTPLRVQIGSASKP